jgi:hypothetical protein
MQRKQPPKSEALYEISKFFISVDKDRNNCFIHEHGIERYRGGERPPALTDPRPH